MKNISDLIARKEYLPMPEDVQQELVEIYGERRVEEDSLIKKFATGMLAGGISAPLGALGVPVMVAPSIINTVGGRVRNVQVLNDGSRLLVKHRHGNNPKPRSDDPGFFTYMAGVAITGLGILLQGSPAGAISPILIGLGAGMLGTGVSIAGEAKAEQSRNRNRRE
ncbi:MAG: hypothetical protein WBD50_02705 [Candidatus Rhabdochlamydia sp.]